MLLFMLKAMAIKQAAYLKFSAYYQHIPITVVVRTTNSLATISLVAALKNSDMQYKCVISLEVLTWLSVYLTGT